MVSFSCGVFFFLCFSQPHYLPARWMQNRWSSIRPTAFDNPLTIENLLIVSACTVLLDFQRSIESPFFPSPCLLSFLGKVEGPCYKIHDVSLAWDSNRKYMIRVWQCHKIGTVQFWIEQPHCHGCDKITTQVRLKPSTQAPGSIVFSQLLLLLLFCKINRIRSQDCRKHPIHRLFISQTRL